VQASGRRRECPSGEGRRRFNRWHLVYALNRSCAGDRLNPILGQRSRQAMKSRQFVITFALLIFGWLWTVLFIAFHRRSSMPELARAS
jgi:hypothetical protein